MTAFLLQNLKLIMLFLLIGSVIGLANVRRESAFVSVLNQRLRASGRARAIFSVSNRIASGRVR
jgi:hypothetical protein